MDQQAIELAQRLAYTDRLTGLVNQNYIDQVLAHEVPRAVQGQQEVVLCLIDLDHFSSLNQRVGFDWGDHLLRELGQELRTKLPEHVLVARRGEDDFEILIYGPKAREQLEQYSPMIWETVTRDREAAGQVLPVKASLGLAIAPGFAQSAEDLRRHASAALAHAKEHGRCRMQYYDKSIRDRRNQERDLQAKLYDLCMGERMGLIYEPIVNLASGQMEGVEITLDWKGDRGELMAALDRCGLGARLGDWVLKEACKAARELGHKYYVVAPLLPGQVLGDTCLQRTLKASQQAKIRPGQICFKDLEVSPQESREGLLDEMCRWGFGLVYQDVTKLLDTSERWPMRKRRFLRVPEEWTSQAPLGEPGARISIGLVRLSAVANTHTICAGLRTFEQVEFFRHAKCDSATGPYFGTFHSIDEVNPRAKWKTGV